MFKKLIQHLSKWNDSYWRMTRSTRLEHSAQWQTWFQNTSPYQNPSLISSVWDRGTPRYSPLIGLDHTESSWMKYAREGYFGTYHWPFYEPVINISCRIVNKTCPFCWQGRVRAPLNVESVPILLLLSFLFENFDLEFKSCHLNATTAQLLH